ncbi:MAG: histidinol dehydrogenase [Gammaproteobacteria bacterium]|nr:MAG: histidinol dehydrogenase [Gammaproteobacteria bacterium]
MRRLDWDALAPAERRAALQRPAVAAAPDTEARVAALIDEVRRDGDSALRRLTAEFDGVQLDELHVSETEVAEARAALPEAALAAIETAMANVESFHRAQASAPLRVETAPGVVCERLVRPIEAVGLYVPAGSAPLPSTAIMLAVPARLAGCPQRILCTPPRADGRADPAVVAAAVSCGVTEIFKLGGAQAIAAMAYGTDSVPRVAKIFGPGNAWVTAAKQAVAADPNGAALDMPAGPSEVMVVADADADPRFVALDLLSQAEHGPDSQALLVTTSVALAGAVETEIGRALVGLGRRQIIEQALAHAAIVLVPAIADAFDVANRYAPEHLIIQVNKPRQYIDLIVNAGSVFLGPWSPESVGDYCSGTNHVLPTYGYARNYSGLSLADFQRRLTVQELSRDGLAGLAQTVETLATLEGLDAHAAAVRVRLDESSR